MCFSGYLVDVLSLSIKIKPSDRHLKMKDFFVSEETHIFSRGSNNDFHVLDLTEVE